MARRSNGPPVLAVVSQKGGAGKTTIATNLAAAAHLKGRRTLLLDTDPQGSSMDWYHLREDGSKLDGLNVALYDKPLTQQKLEQLARGYDQVVVDTPPRLAATARNAAVLASLVLIPIEPAYSNVLALGNTLDALDEADAVREQLGKKPVRRCVILNRVAPRLRLTGLALETLSKRKDYLDSPIRSATAFGLTYGDGESVLTKHGKSSAADDIRVLWNSVSRRMGR